MRWLFALGDALDLLGRCLLGLLLLALLAIVTLQIVDRHVTDVPIVAPDAYARILLIWLTFIGFALAVRAGLAIRVDLMDHLFPPRVRVGLGIAFDLGKLAILAVLIVKGWLLVQIGFDQSILGTDLTTAVPNAGLWLGSLMLFVFVVIALVEAATGRSAGPQHETKTELRAE
jgi:TRAP-type C4-dicarboxylate transport system permease small subunit